MADTNLQAEVETLRKRVAELEALVAEQAVELDECRGVCASQAAEIRRLTAVAANVAESGESGGGGEKAKKTQSHHGVNLQLLPKEMREYVEPKLKLADEVKPIAALQEEYEKAAEDSDRANIRIKMQESLVKLQEQIRAELWRQLGESSHNHAVLKTLVGVMAASNKRFYDIYGCIATGIRDTNVDEYNGFVQDASALKTQCRWVADKCRQSTNDPLEILEQARKVGPLFVEFLGQLTDAVPNTEGKTGPLKKLYRMVEKAALRPRNSRGIIGNDDGLNVDFRCKIELV